MEELKWQCAQILKGAIHDGSIFQIAHLAYMHDEQGLLHACVDFMVRVHDLGPLLAADSCKSLLESPEGQPVASWFKDLVYEQIRKPRESCSREQ